MTTAFVGPEKGEEMTVATTIPGPTGHRGRKAAARWLIPIATGVVMIGAWWLACELFDVPEYLVPSPLDVARTMNEFRDPLADHFLTTLSECLIGFGLSVLLGVVIGTAIARSRIIEQIAYPLLVTMNGVSKVAIAPILVVWMGFGQTPKVVMVVLLCIFSIILSTVAGLRSTPAELVDLSRSLSAGDLREFTKVRFKWALPQLFTGLKTAISLAVIGAVVAELVGSSKGLGYIIVQSGASADTSLAFAAIVLLSVMNIVLFYAFVWLEKVLLPWAEANR